MLADHYFSAVLLDLGSPDESGLAVVRYMRINYNATPVILITARGRLSDCISGLDAGADDYLVKPFQFDELFARIRAITRRSQDRMVKPLVHGEVRVDPDSRKVTRSGKWISLSNHEYSLLLILMERAGRVVSRDQIEEAVYGGHHKTSSNMISVYIYQLRNKLGEKLIATVYGQGYIIGGSA
ncbi:hypothetical protein XPR_0863 [Xanthomonas arboricola pv. pruni MAFF 301420]|nr:two-component system regulatory protein [Xanthomonas arboricola pv. pruni str. MAFF 311562]GAE54228.1 hypothetical protein XPR_0863 [Xanthomonas arboricola pv. pruni MAFF 301420]